MPDNSSILITNTSMYRDILHIVIRGGEASNRGTQPADFVEIAATFYDASIMSTCNKNTFRAYHIQLGHLHNFNDVSGFAIKNACWKSACIIYNT
jgi:hypothetical protein